MVLVSCPPGWGKERHLCPIHTLRRQPCPDGSTRCPLGCSPALGAERHAAGAREAFTASHTLTFGAHAWQATRTPAGSSPDPNPGCRWTSNFAHRALILHTSIAPPPVVHSLSGSCGWKLAVWAAAAKGAETTTAPYARTGNEAGGDASSHMALKCGVA